MEITELGRLKIGNCFYFEGKKYKIMSLGDRPINNVNCWCVDSDGVANFKKRIRLDVQTEVEIKEIKQ